MSSFRFLFFMTPTPGKITFLFLSLLCAAGLPGRAPAQAWPWTAYPTFFPSDTNIPLTTLPDELGTGQSLTAQFLAINYTTTDWTNSTAYLAVTQDTAGLFSSRRIDLPDGITVGFIRQGRFTTAITAPATAQDAVVTIQMATSTGELFGLPTTKTIRIRPHGVLTAQNFQMTAPTVSPGSTEKFTLTLTNSGAAPTAPQQIQFWLSPDPAFWATQAPADYGWQLTAPAGAGPDPRLMATMVFEPVSGKAILFGGSSDKTIFGDTWEYTPPSASAPASWRQLAIAGPAPRDGHCMVVDSARGVVVLYGGRGTGGLLGDTWEYTFDGGWKQTATGGPSVRERAAMVYDEARGKIVLFGGVGLQPLNDTWEYTVGAGWTQVATTTAPDPRGHHAMAYDSTRGRILMLGGRGFGLTGDMWQYTPGKGWSSLPVGWLPPHEGHVMIYDPKRDRLVMFGGLDVTDYRGETLEWRDATGWRLLPTLGPATRSQGAAVYDPVRGRLVIFGGWDSYNLGDTWELPCGGNDRLLGQRNLGALAAGQSAALELDVSGTALGIPDRLAPGRYWVGAIPDALGFPADAPQPAGAFVLEAPLTVSTLNAVRRWAIYE